MPLEEDLDAPPFLPLLLLFEISIIVPVPVAWILLSPFFDPYAWLLTFLE